MTQKDKKIIADNPGLSPYEYQLKGVSQTGFNELLQEHDEKVANELKARPPRQVIAPVIKPSMPELSTFGQHMSDTVTLRNERNGALRSYDRTTGLRMARLYPNEFKVME